MENFRLQVPEPAFSAPCPVCTLPAGQYPATADSPRVACDRCGQIEVADAAATLLARHPDLRSEASAMARQAPRPADGWLFVTVYMLHEMFPAELGPVDG